MQMSVGLEPAFGKIPKARQVAAFMRRHRTWQPLRGEVTALTRDTFAAARGIFGPSASLNSAERDLRRFLGFLGL